MNFSEVIKSLDWTAIVLAFLAASPGFWAALKQYKKEKKEADKITADTASVLTDTARDLVEEMRTEMRKSSSKIELLEKKGAVYEKVIRILIRQVRDSGVEPIISEDDLELMLHEAGKKEEKLND